MTIATVKTFSMKGPGGVKMVTQAKTKAKAWSNLRFRLVTQFNMTWWDAREFDNSDLAEEK